MAGSNKELSGFFSGLQAADVAIKEQNEMKSEIYKAAKAAGFNPKIIRKLLTEAKMDEGKRHEERDLLEEYRTMLNLE